MFKIFSGFPNKFSLRSLLGAMSSININKSVSSQPERQVEVASVAADHENSFTPKRLEALLAPHELVFKKTFCLEYGRELRQTKCLNQLFREVLEKVGDVFRREREQRLNVLMKAEAIERRENPEPELQFHPHDSKHKLVLNIIDPQTPKYTLREVLDGCGVLSIFKVGKGGVAKLTQQIFYKHLSEEVSQKIQICFDPETGKRNYFSIDGVLKGTFDKRDKATLHDGVPAKVFQTSTLLTKVPKLFDPITNNTVKASPAMSSQKITTSSVNPLKEWGDQVLRNPVARWTSWGIGSWTTILLLNKFLPSESYVSSINNKTEINRIVSPEPKKVPTITCSQSTFAQRPQLTSVIFPSLNCLESSLNNQFSGLTFHFKSGATTPLQSKQTAPR
jgi:hypothetical protein